MSEQDDPRDRMRSPYHRVVAPNARRQGSRVFINGPLVLEKSYRNAKGEENWLTLQRWEKRPTLGEDSELDIALYVLLSNGAE